MEEVDRYGSKDKVIIITGVVFDIGPAAAILFAQRRAKVMIARKSVSNQQ